MTSPQPSWPVEIDVTQVRDLQQGPESWLLLDCREASELAVVRIAGALHIPMREIQARLTELEPYRQQRVVVYCHHGGRSLRVTQWLREQGFSRAQNMAGGIDAWSLQIDPSLPRY